MTTPASIKLYILGAIDRRVDAQEITVFAEFREARGLSHVHLDRSKMDFLFQAIENLRGFVEGGVPQLNRKNLRELGHKLQEFLLVGKTRELFTHATAVARTESLGRLPLEIIAEDYEIAGWPWEYLHDYERGFIAQDFHPISRSIFSIETAPPCPPLTGKIKILVILGVPPDDSFTSPQEELAAISNIFTTQLAQDMFEIRFLDAVQLKHLVLELQNQEYHIIHFFGHAGFDAEDETGYLSFSRPGVEPFRIHADFFAQLLSERRSIRLVFLNACKTAQGSTTEGPGRSSVAGALLAKGIPAVVGAQFSMPELSAHFLAATVYNALLTGKPIGEAMRDGRTSMGVADTAKFFDWGIPVLYTKDSGMIIFPLVGKKPSWAAPFEAAIRTGHLIERSIGSGAPAVVVESTKEADSTYRSNVALIDLDAKVGFLPELAVNANSAQSYYHFEVAYLPVPAGYVRADLGKRPQTYIPRLEKYLASVTEVLSVDFACCITRHPVAGKHGKHVFYEHFAADLTDGKVFVISTAGLREYAAAAKSSFEKAVFRSCLSMIVAGDARWNIKLHPETEGCLFDYCDDRRDIVVGLRNTVFSHKKCRDLIEDKRQLEAIDALMTISAPTGVADSGQESKQKEPKRSREPGGPTEPSQNVSAVRIKEENGDTRLVPVKSGSTYMIGRAREMDIMLSESDKTVSRQHAKMVVYDEYVEVIDQGSKNKITLDNDETERTYVIVEPHQSFFLGNAQFIVVP
jgi:hypothetical protein